MSKIMDPRSLLHGIGILAVAGLVGCGGGRAHGPASPDTSAAVDMGFSSFQPEAVHIRAGQTVGWRNTSIITHSVTDDSRAAPKPQDASIPAGATAFSSGDIPAGEVFAASFPVPGTYKYFCTHHEGEGMVGTVVVEPASLRATTMAHAAMLRLHGQSYTPRAFPPTEDAVHEAHHQEGRARLF
jgi:plastocyanin